MSCHCWCRPGNGKDCDRQPIILLTFCEAFFSLMAVSLRCAHILYFVASFLIDCFSWFFTCLDWSSGLFVGFCIELVSFHVCWLCSDASIDSTASFLHRSLASAFINGRTDSIAEDESCAGDVGKWPSELRFTLYCMIPFWMCFICIVTLLFAYIWLVYTQYFLVYLNIL